MRMLVITLGLLVLPATRCCVAADSNYGVQLFNTGNYAECIEQATAAIETGDDTEQWRKLLIESELIQGQHETALAATEEALREHPLSIPLRLLAYRIYRENNQPVQADVELETVGRLAVSRRRQYLSPESRVALGRYFLQQGADARQVLEIFYDPVVRNHPDFLAAHLASAQLALDKFDNALAVETLKKAPESAQSDPEYHFLLARAYSDSDAEKASAELEAALRINPHHSDSLLFQVDNLIDGEAYNDARKVLDSIFDVNPHHPAAWAYVAVLENLAGDKTAEGAARDHALSQWQTNPAVDYTIGRKLSDKYRFAEGAKHQRQALAMDASYLPARMQLAQDLLRLGQEEEGWQLAISVADADGYNVVAHNLAKLHDSLNKYHILSNDSFRVRMDSREAAVYGPRVLELLDRAKEMLCKKYEVTLNEPVIVDIFPRKQDFAVRTFGLPGAEGFLGVCFGNVITANSPAALGATKANWESVLWHEFCHVVTLHKSHNKMPRWLSEGISVYEERQADPAWGEKLTPQYREMIVDDKAPALSELSAAFLAPESPLALQFAYYESSQVVEMLVEKYGAASVNRILDDLGAGIQIDDALARNAAPLNRLDRQFSEYLQKRVDEWAPLITWEDCDLPQEAGSAALAAWLEDHPGNLAGMIRLTLAQQREELWRESIATARQLREMFPTYAGAGNSYQLLARAYRETQQPTPEREALEAWTQRDAEATDAYERLIELGEESGDWAAVLTSAQQLLAVNPLAPDVHRKLAQAAEQLELPAEAESAYQSLLKFDTSDLVDIHYRLAILLRQRGDIAGARRHTLMALEDAPRYRQALELLLELEDLQAAGE